MSSCLCWPDKHGCENRAKHEAASHITNLLVSVNVRLSARVHSSSLAVGFLAFMPDARALVDSQDIICRAGTLLASGGSLLGHTRAKNSGVFSRNHDIKVNSLTLHPS